MNTTSLLSLADAPRHLSLHLPEQVRWVDGLVPGRKIALRAKKKGATVPVTILVRTPHSAILQTNGGDLITYSTSTTPRK